MEEIWRTLLTPQLTDREIIRARNHTLQFKLGLNPLHPLHPGLTGAAQKVVGITPGEDQTLRFLSLQIVLKDQRANLMPFVLLLLLSKGYDLQETEHEIIIIVPIGPEITPVDSTNAMEADMVNSFHSFKCVFYPDAHLHILISLIFMLCRYGR